MTIDKEKLKTKFDKSIVLDENLNKYSWFNIGGPAEIFFRPRNESELVKFLEKNEFKKENLNILGAGSNTLIRDGGIKGITIKLSSNFSHCKLLDKNIIEVGAATLDKNISNFAIKNSISGLEFLACIPGTIGGSIVMNSGCYDFDISKVLKSIKVLTFNGVTKTIDRKDIKFHYRGTNLPKNILIISAKLIGKRSSMKSVADITNDFIQRKKLSQPSSVKTCGSTFKNPPNEKAWSLIKRSSCQGLSFWSS